MWQCQDFESTCLLKISARDAVMPILNQMPNLHPVMAILQMYFFWLLKTLPLQDSSLPSVGPRVKIAFNFSLKETAKSQQKLHRRRNSTISQQHILGCSKHKNWAVGGQREEEEGGQEEEGGEEG